MLTEKIKNYLNEYISQEVYVQVAVAKGKNKISTNAAITKYFESNHFIGLAEGKPYNTFLDDLKDRLTNLESWTEASLDEVLLEYRSEKDLSVPKVNQPIRIALTGSTNSPSLGMTMFLFEKDEVIKRINDLIVLVQSSS